MKTLFCAFAALAAFASLAACNYGSSTPPPPAPCATPTGDTTVLVYPAPNATAVPDAFGQIIVGSTAALPGNYQLVAATVAYIPAGGGAFTSAAQPFPTPNATPSFSNPVYQSSSFSGATIVGQVVRVFINNPQSSCTPVGPIGSFTTQ